MDGGNEERQQLSDGLDDVERRWRARRSRAAADAEVLAGAPFLADAVDRLRSAIADLLDVRWAAASPDELRAALRCLADERARLDAAVLGSVRALDGRDAGDLRVVGAAIAAGEISREHADIAARVHERLGGTVRDAPVDGQVDGQVDGGRGCAASTWSTPRWRGTPVR